MRIINTWFRDKVSKKKLKRLRKEKKRLYLVDKAKELQKHTPASELWFYERFSLESVPRIAGSGIYADQKNVPFENTYIPDILNDGYRYVIEIDGSVHETLKQAYKDFSKNRLYYKRGYKVFRVKAYSEESYNKFMEEYKTYIQECHNTFLAGLFSVVSGVILPSLSKKQRQTIRKAGRHVKIQCMIPIKANVIKEKGLGVKKPKTILRKAKVAV